MQLQILLQSSITANPSTHKYISILFKLKLFIFISVAILFMYPHNFAARMSKIRIQITIAGKLSKADICIFLAYYPAACSEPSKPKYYQQLFQTQEQLLKFLQAIIFDISQSGPLSELAFIIQNGAAFKYNEHNGCKFQIINQAISLFTSNFSFLTSLSVYSRDSAFYNQDKDRKNQPYKSLDTSHLQCKFIKRLAFQNQILNWQGLASLTLISYQYLKIVSIINHSINNLALEYLTRSNWPSLTTLALFDRRSTADGHKLLRKHTIYSLQQFRCQAEIGSQSSRQLVKVHASSKIVIFQRFLQNQLLMNINRSIFLKQLVKSVLFKNYSQCKSTQQIRYKIIGDVKQLSL